MDRKHSMQSLCAAALLIAVGIVIPMFSPVKIVLPTASFTLASHVAIFIAMMISPGVAAAVALGTTAGFLLGGFPVMVVLRAATHLVFVLLGAFYIQKNPGVLASPVKVRVFSLAIGVIHAFCEVVVVTGFFFGGNMDVTYGFVQSVLLLVGVGSIIHSMVDFEISLVIVKALQKQKSFSSLVGSAAR